MLMVDKKHVIATALLEGSDPLDRLIEAGYSEASAAYEVRRLEKDPMAIALQQAVRRIYKRDWTLGIYGNLAAARDGGLSVPIIGNPEPRTFFEDFYAANRPAVLKGLVDHWPALELWDLDYLDAKVGSALVQIQTGRDSGHSELDKAAMASTSLMRDITARIRRTESSNDFYVTAYDSDANRAALSPLYEDLGPISILVADSDRPGFFWLGPKGTLTPFHHDLTNNLLVQIMGRKKVRLVPSWEVGRMKNHLHCYSEREVADWERGNDLPPILDVTIGPGDALFLPVGWWHHVEALDASISMSFTSFDAPNDFYTDYRGFVTY